MQNLLIIHNNSNAPWIEFDSKALSPFFNVKSREISSVVPTLEACKDLWKANVVIFWFASFHFYLLLAISRIMGKKIIVIAGGYDVSKLPEIQYGAFCENYFKIILRKLFFRLSYKVIGVSNSNLLELHENVGLKDKSSFCHLGFPKIEISILPFSKRKNQVVMIANIDSERTAKLKGLDVFFQVARTLPQFKFILIGKINCKRIDTPKNVELVGSLQYRGKEFLSILNQSKIIFQHSMLESFCAAVVDGAMCGCIPIVSNRYSLPEIVGMDGIIVNYGDIEKLCSVICHNIQNPILEPEKLNSIYEEKYSLRRRGQCISYLIKD